MILSASVTPAQKESQKAICHLAFLSRGHMSVTANAVRSQIGRSLALQPGKSLGNCLSAAIHAVGAHALAKFISKT